MAILDKINVNGTAYDLQDSAAARAANTYTKGEVDSLVAAIKQFKPVSAQTLPTASADTMCKLYLIPSEDPKESNTKDEYITIDNGASANPRYTWEKIGSTDIDLSPYYIKPDGGIPKTDLAEDVQTSLGKADTALQEHQSLEEYAKKDGFYITLGAGTAVNIAGKQERTNDKLFRTSGGSDDIATGTARLEKIEGQTEVIDGSLRSVQMTALKTIGFNIFDKDNVTNNFIHFSTGKVVYNNAMRLSDYLRVVPNAGYYFGEGQNAGSTGSTGIAWYDSDKNLISVTKTNKYNYKVVTAPANAAYLRVSIYLTYLYTYCVNLSWSGVKNGQYEPYEEYTLPIPITTMTGKLNSGGESVVLFPQGMGKWDSLYYSGSKTYASVGGQFRAYQDGDVTSGTMITDGITTYEQLAEPLIYEVDEFTLPARYQVNDYGTEEQVGTQVAATLTLLYGINAADFIRRAPERFLESITQEEFDEIFND